MLQDTGHKSEITKTGITTMKQDGIKGKALHEHRKGCGRLLARWKVQGIMSIVFCETNG